MFNRLLRHPAWKRRGPILISALHKFVTYLLTYLHLPTYLQPRDPQGAGLTAVSNEKRIHWLIMKKTFIK